MLEITDGSDFQKNKPQRNRIEMKNKVKAFYFRDHIRTWTVISIKKKEKKIFTLFSNQRAARASTVFPNLAGRVKSLPTPAIESVADQEYSVEHCLSTA